MGVRELILVASLFNPLPPPSPVDCVKMTNYFFRTSCALLSVCLFACSWLLSSPWLLRLSRPIADLSVTSSRSIRLLLSVNGIAQDTAAVSGCKNSQADMRTAHHQLLLPNFRSVAVGLAACVSLASLLSAATTTSSPHCRYLIYPVAIYPLTSQRKRYCLGHGGSIWLREFSGRCADCSSRRGIQYGRMS